IVDEVGPRDIECRLIKICTYQEEWMVFQHFAAQGMSFDGFKNMLDKSSVSTTHIQNSLRLQVNRLIEYGDDEICHHPEIGRVGTAAAPDIHLSVYMDFIFAFTDFTELSGIA